MLDMFQNQLSTTKESHFSAGWSRFLDDFLLMQDCFLVKPSGYYVEVDFEFQYSRSVLTATGKVTWQPPDVRFDYVSDRLFPGEVYRIRPFARCGDLDQVTYTLPRSSLSFDWDASTRCFKTTVPSYVDVSKLRASDT